MEFPIDENLVQACRVRRSDGIVYAFEDRFSIHDEVIDSILFYNGVSINQMLSLILFCEKTNKLIPCKNIDFLFKSKTEKNSPKNLYEVSVECDRNIVFTIESFGRDFDAESTSRYSWLREQKEGQSGI